MDIEQLRTLLHQKISDLEVVLKEDIQYSGYDYFNDIYLIPNSLTPVSIDQVDLTTTFLEKTLDLPLIIAPMTGGSKHVVEINKKIAEFAVKYNIGMGVGDQFFGLHYKKKIGTYSIFRETAPKNVIIGNLAAKDILTSENYLADVKEAISMIKADALHIYLSPLNEMILRHKQTGFSGLAERLQALVDGIEVPIIIKSMGLGLSNEDVKQLWDLGINIIDIQGVGGTNLARVETVKNMSLTEKQTGSAQSKPFDFWGLPSLWALLDIAVRPENQDFSLILGGGIRNGLQAVKALALGADIISLGYPILIQLTEDIGYPDEENLEEWFDTFIYEMKMTMALLGARTISDLREVARNRLVILGKTKEWMMARDLCFPPLKCNDLPD